jgi:NAD(P)-dependent dehydrogenase (short-subunit alcohol dehydrogenase family)
MGVLEGKVAVVTGAGQGIGRGIAHAFAREGAAVVIVEIDETRGKTVAAELEELGARAIAVAADIRDSRQVDECVATVVERLGGIDILVNNAKSDAPERRIEELTDAHIEEKFAVGPKATLFFMRAAFPYLRERQGKVINFRSSAGPMGMVGCAPYNAAKEAIGAITRTAAREWGQYGITVNAISPAAASPGMQEWAALHPEKADALLASRPIARWGDCERDIGRVAVFLASADADFVTGATIPADGGTYFLS